MNRPEPKYLEYAEEAQAAAIPPSEVPKVPPKQRREYRGKWYTRIDEAKRNPGTWYRYGPYSANNNSLIWDLRKRYGRKELTMDLRLADDGKHYVYLIWKDKK